MALCKELIDLDRPLVPKAIEALFECLGEDERDDDEDPAMRKTLAYIIFEAIAGLEFKNYLNADDTLVPLFERNWNVLIHWMSILTNGIQPDPDTGEMSEGSVQILEVLAQAIRVYCFNSKLERKVLREDAMFKVVMGLWLLQDFKAVSNMPYASEILTRILSQAQQESEAKLLSHLNMVVESSEGGIDVVVDKALLRVSLATKNLAKIRLDSLGNFLNVIFMLCEAASHPLRLRFLQKNSVAVTTKAICAVSQGSPSLNRFVMQTVGMYFHSCRSVLPTGAGAPWILEAVQAGLFNAFANCTPYFPSFFDVNTTGAKFVLSTLSQHLIYYSVLDVIREAFKKVTPRQSLELSKSIIGREWNAFTDLLLERLVIKYQMDKGIKSSDVKGKIVRCTNVSRRLSMDQGRKLIIGYSM